MTCGMPSRPAVVSRSGPAERMPPKSSEVSSFVVRSTTPSMAPCPISSSMAMPAGAVGVEDDGLVAGGLETALHALAPGVVTPIIEMATSGTVRGRRGGPAAHHAGHGVGGVGEDRARDPVEALDVRDGMHQRQVARPHVGPHVARGHRGDEQLGDADGQRAQHGRDDGRAAAAAEAHDAVATALPSPASHERGRAAGHGLQGDGTMASGRAGLAQLLRLEPAARATSSAVTSAATVGLPRMPTSTRRTSTPASWSRSRT